SFDGPIRAIRSWMGANSGALISRTHLFYEQMDEVETNFRVHSIRSFMDFFDFSNKAAGMTWYNEHNLGGFLVDGNPDPVDTSYAKWSLLAGEQGSILINNRIESNFPVDTLFSYYSDRANAPTQQCIGDQNEVAAHGWWIGQRIPNTDPRLGSENNKIDMFLTNFYLGQNKTPANTSYLRDYLDHPLLINEVSASVSQAAGPTGLPVRIIPNPAQEEIKIQVDGLENGVLNVFSIDGRSVWSTKFRNDEVIALPNKLRNGMYYLQIMHEKGISNTKLFIQR
ncbi:MAG: T9SS type A sorting domain-containing protein, partial [Bacteroidota bacterium]